MKTILISVVIATLFLNFQCTKSDGDNNNLIIPQQLEIKKQEILSYVATFTCTDIGGCNFLAFGSKACGGPKEYLVFPNSVDLPFLTAKVTEYNELEKQYNIQTNAVSDCMFVSPPSNVGCVDGKCRIID